MIKSERAYYREMRRMIRSVIAGNNPLPKDPTREDFEVLTECINRGYLLQKGNQDGMLRTMDGSPHPTVELSVVPVKGLAFLRPDRTQQKSSVALWVSIFALLVSLFSNLDKILQNLSSLFRFIVSHFPP